MWDSETPNFNPLTIACDSLDFIKDTWKLPELLLVGELIEVGSVSRLSTTE